MPDPQQPVAAKAAFTQETFSPATVDVAVEDRADHVELKQFVGPVGQLPGVGDLYVVAKIAYLEPDTAIAVGQALVQEGRRIKAGLVIPAARAIADLRAA